MANHTYFTVQGSDFKEVLSREFTSVGEPSANRVADGQLPQFSYQTSYQAINGINLIRFQASFNQSVRVHGFEDTDHLSLHFQLKGYSTASISGLSHNLPLRAGQTCTGLYLSPVSAFEFPRQQVYEYFSISVQPNLAVELLGQVGMLTEQEGFLAGQSFTLSKQALPIRQEQIAILHQLQHDILPNDLRDGYVRLKISELLLWQSATNRQWPSLKFATTVSRQDEERLRALKYYLDEQFLEPITIGDLARVFLLNEFKVKAGFKALFHTTPYQYLLGLRMAYARDQLGNPTVNIARLATDLHYSSASHFAAAFRKHTGVTPSAFTRLGNSSI